MRIGVIVAFLLLFVGARVNETCSSSEILSCDIHGPSPLSFFFEIVTIPSAFAQTGGDEGVVGGLMEGLMNMMGMAIGIILPFLYVLLSMAETLLDPGNIFTPEIQVALRKIWLLSRNIVNTVFAILFFVGAIILIFKPTDERSSQIVKEKLPRFVIAVILVNFSWFIPRVIIDASNILASVIFKIPQMLTVDCRDPADPNKECLVVAHVELFPEHGASPLPANTEKLCEQKIPGFASFGHKKALPVFGEESVVDVCFVPWSKAQKNTQGRILNGLVTNFGLLRHLVDVPTAPPSNSGTPAVRLKLSLMWAMRYVFVAFSILVLFFPLLALCVVLLMRWGVLWLTIAFMPFTFIGYALTGQLTTKVKEGPNLWEYFLGAALLPVYVAIPYSVGFILVNAGYNFGTIHQITSFKAGSPLAMNIADLNHIVWFAMTLAILWKGAFIAMESASYAKDVVTQIRSFGGGLIKAAAQAPTLIPLPIPGAKDQSIGSLMYGAGQLLERQRAVARKQWEDRFGEGGGSADEFLKKFKDKPKEGAAQIKGMGSPAEISAMGASTFNDRVRNNLLLNTKKFTPEEFQKEVQKIRDATTDPEAKYVLTKISERAQSLSDNDTIWKGAGAGAAAGEKAGTGTAGPLTVAGVPALKPIHKSLGSPTGKSSEAFKEIATQVAAAGSLDQKDFLGEVQALKAYANSKGNYGAANELAMMESDLTSLGSGASPAKIKELTARYAAASQIDSPIALSARKTIVLNETEAGKKRNMTNLEFGHVFESLKEKSGSLAVPTKVGQNVQDAYVEHVNMLKDAASKANNHDLATALNTLSQSLQGLKGAGGEPVSQAQVKDVVDTFSQQIINVTIQSSKRDEAIDQNELLKKAMTKKVLGT